MVHSRHHIKTSNNLFCPLKLKIVLYLFSIYIVVLQRRALFKEKSIK